MRAGALEKEATQMTKKKSIMIALIASSCVVLCFLLLFGFLFQWPIWRRDISEPFGITRDPVDTEPVETDIFLDEPDSMVLRMEKEAVQLSDDQLTQVYAQWRQGFDEQSLLAPPCRCLYQPSELQLYLDEYPCLEFRYNQRRHFIGIVGETGTEFENILTDCVYDAMLLVLTESHIKLIAYKDGIYDGIHNSHYELYIKDYSALRELIVSLVSKN